MLVNSILFCLLGLVLVVLCANCLVDGSSDIARRFNISEFVIGLIIVGFGTSLPELVVSTIGAIEGSAEIAIGNVIGSNVVNSTFILGLVSLLVPIGITLKNKEFDIPITIFATLIFVLFGFSGLVINTVEAVIFLILFIIYLKVSIEVGKGEEEITEEAEVVERKLWLSIFYIVSGLCGLIGGGKIFVDSAVKIAQILGMSEKFIGITILAIGTSLPELVTCLIAAFKKKTQMALGDILGSNVFNILLILGVGGSILPLSFIHITLVDIAALLFGVIMIYVSAFKKDRNISWKEGLIMVLGYFSYFGWLVYNL